MVHQKKAFTKVSAFLFYSTYLIGPISVRVPLRFLAGTLGYKTIHRIVLLTPRLMVHLVKTSYTCSDFFQKSIARFAVFPLRKKARYGYHLFTSVPLAQWIGIHDSGCLFCFIRKRLVPFSIRVHTPLHGRDSRQPLKKHTDTDSIIAWSLNREFLCRFWCRGRSKALCLSRTTSQKMPKILISRWVRMFFQWFLNNPPDCFALRLVWWCTSSKQQSDIFRS